MFDKKKKLDERSILTRLSNGAMFQVRGGTSSTFTDAKISPSLGNCLAGCGCTTQRACDVCHALV